MATKKKMLQAAAGVGGGEVAGAWDLGYFVATGPAPLDHPEIDRRVSYANVLTDYGINNPWGIYVRPDGMKLYVTNAGGDDVFEFNLKTPFVFSRDLSTLTLVASVDIAVLSGGNSAYGLFISPDGTRLYSTETLNSEVMQYSMSTPWDITSISYVQSLSVYSQEIALRSVTFSPDGTLMFVAGTVSDSIHKYTLSTAWDISTASLSQSSATLGNLEGISFTDDGLNLVTTDGGVVTARKLSSAWDLSTISGVVATLSPTNTSGCFVTGDGVHTYFALDSTFDRLYYDFSGGILNPTSYWGLTFSDGGNNLIASNSSATVASFPLSEPYDISSMVNNGSGFPITLPGGATDITEVVFKPDGTKAFSCCEGTDRIYEYSLSTAWDLTTATNTSSVSIAADESVPKSVAFSTDGTKVYYCGTTTDTLYQRTLNTPWTIADGWGAATTMGPGSNPYTIKFHPDGTYLYSLHGSDLLFQWELSTPWDISTAVKIHEIDTDFYGSNCWSFAFNADGTEITMHDATDRFIFTIDLREPE